MREGSGLVRFSKEFPDRYFDVGIAEQHAVTYAAGLACEGARPVVAIYSTFLQRAYDQLIHDVALQNLPVLFALDRGGLVGADGPTHHGAFDLSFLRCIPNMVVMTPADENECRQMLYSGYMLGKPVAVRYPRGVGPGVPIISEMTAIPLGKAEVRRRGARVAILVFGGLLNVALNVGESLNATVVNMRFVKPIDKDMLRTVSDSHEMLVTLEENVIMGGAGSAVLEALSALGIQIATMRLGLPDRFVDHGDPALLLKECGLDAQGIHDAIQAAMIAQ
jgi:1-deoxy-D-xylulose-5-phosphate synthase